MQFIANNMIPFWNNTDVKAILRPRYMHMHYADINQCYACMYWVVQITETGKENRALWLDNETLSNIKRAKLEFELYEYLYIKIYAEAFIWPLYGHKEL